MNYLRKTGVILCVLLVVALVAGCGLFGPKKGTITGVVLDKYSLEPIKGALVQITDLSKTTADDGTFTFADLPLGAATVKVTKEGYKVANQAFTIEETTNLPLYLEKDIDPAHNIVDNFNDTSYRACFKIENRNIKIPTYA